jgi:hypothetical protein
LAKKVFQKSFKKSKKLPWRPKYETKKFWKNKKIPGVTGTEPQNKTERQALCHCAIRATLHKHYNAHIKTRLFPSLSPIDNHSMILS